MTVLGILEVVVLVVKQLELSLFYDMLVLVSVH